MGTAEIRDCIVNWTGQIISLTYCPENSWTDGQSVVPYPAYKLLLLVVEAEGMDCGCNTG